MYPTASPSMKPPMWARYATPPPATPKPPMKNGIDFEKLARTEESTWL